MKTTQEQVEQMMLDVPQTMVAYDANPKGQHLYGEQRLQIAEILYDKDYGKVSEYKAEIERLKAENKSRERENGFLKYCQCLTHGVDGSSHIKKAQIDVLNKAKEKLDSAPNGWAYTTYIDELIEEVQNEN